MNRIRRYFERLGPGLVTGASDDDPSGIGTYSSVGAAFGLQLLWLAAWLLPLMTAVQETCARIGLVTREGLAAVLMKRYRRSLVGFMIVILLGANIVNIGADLQAMAASLQLLIPMRFVVAALIFTVLIILTEVFVPYKRYSKYLKYLTVTLFAYVITGLVTRPDWLQVMKNTVVPRLSLDKAILFAILAFYGTTISPYLFFWQSSQEVEESVKEEKRLREVELGEARHRGRARRERARGEAEDGRNIQSIKSMRVDVLTGMLLSEVVAFFIVLTTSQTLHQHHIVNISSAQQAASALQPLAGRYSSLLFTIGIVTTGLLAVPVLAGSGAYALSELMRWREGLGRRFNRARRFYLVMILSVTVGFVLNFTGISPIKALYYAAFINGVVSVPLLFLILRIGNDARLMGSRTNPRWVMVFGWAAFAFSALALLATAALYIFPVLSK